MRDARIVTDVVVADAGATFSINGTVAGARKAHDLKIAVSRAISRISL
jgi:hypothetical protein